MQICGWFLFAEESGLTIEPYAEFELDLPRQTIQTEPYINMQAVARTTVWAVILSFMLKFWLSNLLSSLLSMIRALTLMAHMMLINLWYPSNVQAFFGQVFDLLSFDALPTELFYPQIFKFHDSAFADQFDALGYFSHNTISNLGSLFLVLMLQPILFLIFGCVQCCDVHPRKKGRKWAIKKRHSLCCNQLIELINEPYLLLCVVTFIHWQIQG